MPLQLSAVFHIRIRVSSLVLCTLAGAACGVAETRSRDGVSHRVIARVEPIDQSYAVMAAIPCFQQQPGFASLVASAADGRELVRLAYTRVHVGNHVMLRDVALVHSVWKASWLDRCILSTLEGLSFIEPEGSPPERSGDEPHELGFPKMLLHDLL